MKNTKRIHSVKLKRMYDESPDTFWLGEYANSPNSDFSIDRAHSEDCTAQPYNHVSAEASAHLSFAIQYLEDLQSEEEGQLEHSQGCSYRFSDAAECSCIVSAIYAGVHDALDLLYQTRDAECACGERGDMRRHEYRYFNPSFNYIDAQGNPLPNETPETVRKYTRQDYERMESLHRGDFCFIGISAEADYFVSTGRGHSLIQTVMSGGLWGVESDCSRADFEEIESEQLAELKEQLTAIGFSKRAIAAAFKNVEREEL